MISKNSLYNYIGRANVKQCMNFGVNWQIHTKYECWKNFENRIIPL